MSQRIGHERVLLWMVQARGRAGWKLFVGSLHEMVAYINRLHRESGVQYCAREVGPETRCSISIYLPA
jgi:hypothetical protein